MHRFCAKNSNFCQKWRSIFFSIFCNLVGRLFRFLKFFDWYFFDKYRRIPNIEKYRKRQNFLGRYFFDNIEKYISKKYRIEPGSILYLSLQIIFALMPSTRKKIIIIPLLLIVGMNLILILKNRKIGKIEIIKNGIQSINFRIDTCSVYANQNIRFVWESSF